MFKVVTLIMHSMKFLSCTH